MMLSLYWIGIDQPAKGTILPAAHTVLSSEYTWRLKMWAWLCALLRSVGCRGCGRVWHIGLGTALMHRKVI